MTETPPAPHRDFGGLLDRTGWSHAELAYRLGMATASIRDWRERRRNPPPAILDYLERIAAAIDSVGPPPPAPRSGRPSNESNRS